MNKKNIFLNLVILVLLASFVVLPLLVSCTDNIESDTDTDKNTGNSEGENAENIDNPATDPMILPDIPIEMDYGGRDFTFLTRTVTSNRAVWIDWDHRDIYAEGQNGDRINDSVYSRNKKIENDYNINIKEVTTDNWLADIRRAINADIPDYDVVMPRLWDCVTLAQDGLFYDLYDVPHIDLAKPWWSQIAVRELSIANRLYFVQGDLLILDNDSVSAMIFNKKIREENELENPYALVKEGKWTLDKLFSMSKGIAKDLNGDGTMYIRDDLFGCITQLDTNLAFFYGAGCRIIEKDSDDLPVDVFENSKSYEVLEKIYYFMTDSDNVVILHKYLGEFGIYDEQKKMILENRALFSWIRLRVVEELRGMEADFGIIPQPKYDESQPDYISPINVHTSTVICVPNSAPDFECAGIILEALSAESKYSLQPAYYDINLYGKFIRDDESREMLEIILGNTMYDISEIYNFGGFTDTIARFPVDDKSSYVSAYEQRIKIIQQGIDKMVENYKSFD